MHTLTISFGPAGANWALMFKTEETGKAAFDNLSVSRAIGGPVNIKDDFGQEIHIRLDQVHCAILEDMDKTQLAIVERSIHQAKTQAKAQLQASNDPALKTAAMAGRGPSMLSPMNGGGYPRN